MKAFVCSVGEKTTQVCCEQLKRFGFDVILLDGKQQWIDKYKRFIKTTNEDCIRVDADIIPNKNVKEIEVDRVANKFGLITYTGYDFYKNDIGVIGVVFYRKKVLDILKRNLSILDAKRPETSASRLSEILPYRFNSSLITGSHGLFQDNETMQRAEKNKKERGQLKQYDFNLTYNLMKLK